MSMKREMPLAIFHKVHIIKQKNIGEEMSDLRDRINLGTWGVFRTGWWIIHIVGIVVVGYIGYWIAMM